jgi:hypothetical protein
MNRTELAPLQAVTDAAQTVEGPLADRVSLSRIP